MCSFDLPDIPGDELPVQVPAPALWAILQPQGTPEQLLEAPAALPDATCALQPEDLDAQALSLYNAACAEASEGHEFSYIFQHVDWTLVDAAIAPAGADEASLLFPELDGLGADAFKEAIATPDAADTEALAFTDSVIADLKGLYGIETTGVSTITVADEDADAEFLALFPSPEELLDAFPESASSETVTAPLSPCVEITSAIEDTEMHDVIDASATAVPTTEMNVQQSESAGTGAESADLERPAVKVDFLAAIIDLTADEELDDDEPDAVHAALAASAWRSDVHTNALNRIIDELEADKARLESTLAAHEAAQRLRDAHISALSDDVHALTADRTELRGAVSKAEAAHASALAKSEADRVRIAELRSKLSAVEDQLQQLRTELQDERSMIATLSLSVGDCKAALGEAEARNQSLHSQLYEEREIAQGTREHLATIQNTLLELRGQLHEEAAAARDAISRQAALEAELEEARSSAAAAEAKSDFFEEQAFDAAKAFDALYCDTETLKDELNTTRAALAASDAQLQYEREISAAKVVAVEQEYQNRLDQQQLQHQEEVAAAEERRQAAEAEFRAEIMRLRGLVSQTGKTLEHVTMQASAIAEQHQNHLVTEAALAKERWISARKSEDMKLLRQENKNLQERLTASEHTSFKLDEEVGSLASRVNSMSEEKRAVDVQLAEKSAVIEDLVQVNQRMGVQMENVREELAALYEEHEASRSASEDSLDAVRQLKSDFEEQTCATLESVLSEKEALRAGKSAAERELVRVRRASQGEIDALKKDIAELRRALQRKPQHAELYETKKLVSVYTERIANCAACAVTSTPQARLTAKGKENIGSGDDSLFGISVDNILSNLIFNPRSPSASPVLN